MASDRSPRPETHALDALIRETIAQLQRGVRVPGPDAMLFLGHWHDAFPALVVQDPVLEPVDKVVWMVIRQQARASGRSTAFPSYPVIAQRANVASTSTVSRSLAILRATRWLSLCARVRHPGGQFRGNVYALHEEPLPLVDALHLDPEYMAFLREAIGHHHARVRGVARGVLESIDEDIAAGVDPCAAQGAIERRLEAVRALAEGGARRYFSLSARALARLRNTGAEGVADDHDQKSKAAAAPLRISSPQNSKAADNSSGSSRSKITTTTGEGVERSKGPGETAALVYPQRLTSNERGLAARYLAQIPADQRQAVLDELEGRVRAERNGAQPVHSELSYLRHLCEQVKGGGFEPMRGLKVREERARREREEAERRARAEKTAPATPGPVASRPTGESPLAEIRRSLRLAARRNEPSVPAS